MIDSGYGITPKCLTDRECDAVVAALLDGSLSRTRAGARHLISHPAVNALANSKALMEIAGEWLGASAVPFRATLFEKSGSTNWLVPWHQDTALPLAHRFESPGWGPWSEKAGVIYCHAPPSALSRVIALRVHLDVSMRDNGPLRVVPGSHTGGVLSNWEVMDYLATHDSVECLAPRGGVIAMRPLLIHASSKARSAAFRRVLHIEYADSLVIENGIRLAVA